PRNLFGLLTDRSVPHDLVHGPPRAAVHSLVAVFEQGTGFDAFDAELLGDLTSRTLVVGLAGRAHAAGQHVVRARIHVFRHRPPLDVDRARDVTDEHVATAVQKVAGAD